MNENSKNYQDWLLKAGNDLKETSLPKIHDLITLLNLCLQKDKTLESLRNESKVLNKYYIEAKYPPDMPIKYTKEEAKEAIKQLVSG